VIRDEAIIISFVSTKIGATRVYWFGMSLYKTLFLSQLFVKMHLLISIAARWAFSPGREGALAPDSEPGLRFRTKDPPFVPAQRIRVKAPPTNRD